MSTVTSKTLETPNDTQISTAYQRIDLNKNDSVVELYIEDCMAQSDQSIVRKLLQYVDHKTYKSLRLCSRSWEKIITAVKPPKFPAVYLLPRELIQQIYFYLCPSDVDAARHTCHSWYWASIDHYVLHAMLQRGGWMSGAVAESKASDAQREIPQNPLFQPGFLSKCFARECALLPAWRGVTFNSSSSGSAWQGVEAPRILSSAMTLTSYTDMTELSDGGVTTISELGCGLGFTVSACGRFVMAADGCIIYVYELNGSNIRYLTTVICPRRVLAMSMDTSAGRYLLGALLDSRMAVVFDLEAQNLQKDTSMAAAPARDHSSTPTSRGQGTKTRSTDTVELTTQSNESKWSNIPGPTSPSQPGIMSNIQFQSSPQSISLSDTSIESELEVANQPWQRLLPSGGLSVYHSLCSPNDPPRSIVICPTRHCLAFGCSAGIELHWVDALTGENSMKWFPLTTTSDFLSFLSTREGIDNADKLRLISSRAGPGQRSGIHRYIRKGRGRVHGLYWNHGTMESEADHFAAVPLSDGSHILFTDPTTGKLCLGIDTPSVGPTNILRKVVFIPPEGIFASKDEPPSVYAAGADLSWGVRVVAVYGDSVILYCLPPEVFTYVKDVNVNLPTVPDEDNAEDVLGVWREWWDYSDLPKARLPVTHQQGLSSTGKSSPLFAMTLPIPVHGSFVGSAAGIVDVALQNSQEFVIWGFSATGLARTWELGTDTKMTIRFASKDGAITEYQQQEHPQSTVSLDEDGDVIMGNTSFSYDGVNEFDVDRDSHILGDMSNTTEVHAGINEVTNIRTIDTDLTCIELCKLDAGEKEKKASKIEKVEAGNAGMITASSLDRYRGQQACDDSITQTKQWTNPATLATTSIHFDAKKSCSEVQQKPETSLQQMSPGYEVYASAEGSLFGWWSTKTTSSTRNEVKAICWETSCTSQDVIEAPAHHHTRTDQAGN